MYRSACIGIASILMSMSVAGGAHAQTAPTRASCAASAAYRDGQPVVPTNLQIGAEVLLNGIPYRIYEGMTIESICETHLPWMARLATAQTEVDRATAKARQTEEEGRTNAEFVRNTQADTVRMYPYEMMILAAIASPITLVLLFLFFKGVLGFFPKRRRYSRRFCNLN